MTSHSNTIYLRGTVVSGLGEGAKYVLLYREVFNQVLGIDPFPGTLNIDVGLDASKILPLDKAVVVPPPQNGFGSVYAFKALLFNREEVYVIRPAKTKHSWRILEVVSKYNLRKKYGLKDGSIVELYIML
jgi:riboflavin kinase